MSFDTALLNLVGAGLGVVGSRCLDVPDRVIRQSEPAALLAFLSREGCGRQIAMLAQNVARALVVPYRADPDRVVRHIQQATALLPDQALSQEPAMQVAWDLVRKQHEDSALAARDGVRIENCSLHACEQLATAILAQPRKVGLMAKADLDDGLVDEILRGVLGPVLTDRAGLAAIQPALEKFAGERGRARHKAVPAGRGRSPTAGGAVHARLEALRETIERIATRRGVPVAMLSAVTRALIAGSDRDDDMARQLDVKIVEYKELDARLTRPAEFDAAVATLRAQSAAAISSGRIDLADRLLAQAEDVDLEAAREQIENEVRHLAQASETRMLRGTLEALRGQYRTAAAHCASAASYLPPDDARGRWQLILRQAQVLAREAEERGDLHALEHAVALHQTCLQLRPRQASSKEWAITQHVFGILHFRLGECHGDTAHLHQAVQACRAAADELTGQREPMRWAQALADAAVALHRLGERTGDQAALSDALAAQRETLAVFTRTASPQDWAQAQIGIAGTLLLIAMRDGSNHRLAEAVAAYKSALEVLDAEQAPEQADKARVRLAEALCLVARRDGQTRFIMDAESVLSAIGAGTNHDRLLRDRLPFEWARLQAVRGTVDLELGRRSRAGDRLMRAITSLESALEITSAQTMPLQFAAAQRDAGAAYEALSQLERFAEPRLTLAVAAYRAAVSALDRAIHPRLWAQAGLDLGRVLYLLGLETGTDRWLSESLVVEEAALETVRGLGDPSLAAFIEDSLAERTQQIERLRRGSQARR